MTSSPHLPPRAVVAPRCFATAITSYLGRMQTTLNRKFLALFALALFVVHATGESALASENEIVIGMSAAFTGPSKGLGIELYRGAQAYFEEVNQQGGISGRKIRIKAYDDGYNPIPAIDNTVKLVEKDQAFLLFGYVGTPTVTRVLPLLRRYQDQNTLLFFPFTGAQPHRRAPYSDYVFNLRASYADETAGLVDHLVSIGRKKIAVFYQIDAYGRSGWDGVRKALRKHELLVQGEATYRRGTAFEQSMQKQVDILRQSGADAVICVGAYAACAAFARDARDVGWDVPIANVSFVGSENLMRLLQTRGKETGVDYTVNLINSQVVPSYHDMSLAAVQEYRWLMDKHHPAPPKEMGESDYKLLDYSFVGFEGFLNAKLLVAILRSSPRVDKEHLKEAVEKLTSVDLGIDTPASFGPGKHQGLTQVYYTEVQNGQFIPVQDWKRWRK